MWRETASLIVMTSLGGVGANLARAGSPETAAPPRDLLHEVMAGDTLHLIAGHQYGDVRLRECLWQAEPFEVPNPNRIGQGTLARFPETVLPPESYTEIPTRAPRVLIPIGGPASFEVEDQTSGVTPPTSESPRTEPPTRPKSGASAGPSGRPGASPGPPVYRA
jgi:hypothetical protein